MTRRIIPTILMLEHDQDDRYITQAVLNENNYELQLSFVNNRDDLFAFLLSCEKTNMPYPSLILLNYYAVPESAVEITRQLKGHPRYSHIPVVILSGTVNDDMRRNSYAAGANSLIRKPSSEKEVVSKITCFVRYWFETVDLP